MSVTKTIEKTPIGWVAGPQRTLETPKTPIGRALAHQRSLKTQKHRSLGLPATRNSEKHKKTLIGLPAGYKKRQKRRHTKTLPIFLVVRLHCFELDLFG